MRTLLTLLLFIALTSVAFQVQAQDTIYTVDRISIPCSILDIGEKYITYRKFTLPNGPDFKMPITRAFKIVYSTGEVVEFKMNALIPEDQVKQDQKSPVNVPQSPPATTPGVRNTMSSPDQSPPSYYRPTKTAQNFKPSQKAELKKASFLIGAGLGGFKQKIDGITDLKTEYQLSANFEMGALVRLNENVVILPSISVDLRNYKQTYPISIPVTGPTGIQRIVNTDLTENHNLTYFSSGFTLGSFISKNKGTGAFLPLIGLSLDYFTSGNYSVEGEFSAFGTNFTIQNSGSVVRGVYRFDTVFTDKNQYLKGLDVVPKIGFMVLISDNTMFRILYNHGLVNLFPGVTNVPSGFGIPGISIRNRYFFVSGFFRF